MKNFIVVVYDIKDDNTRNRVCNTLKNYGTHVQLSVFECVLDASQYQRMKRSIERLIDVDEDLVRFYKLCESCRKKCELLGEGEFTEDSDIYIV